MAPDPKEMEREAEAHKEKGEKLHDAAEKQKEADKAREESEKE